MSYISRGPPAQDSRTIARAFRALSDWRQHSQPGDLAQAQIFFTDPIARCAYGQPITAGKLYWIEKMILGGGDFALVHLLHRRVALVDDRVLFAMAEAAHVST